MKLMYAGSVLVVCGVLVCLHSHHPAVEQSGRAVHDAVPLGDLAFVPNLGQWSHPAAFIARQKDSAVFVEDTGFSVRIGNAENERLVSLRFLNARENARVVAEDPREETYNYFLGNDPSRWKTDVTAFSAVRYESLYDGVDVRLRSSENHLEYDLILAPRANLEGIAIEAEGIDEMTLADDGSLILRSGGDEIRQTAPRTWQETADHETILLASSVKLLGGNRFSLSVPDRDPSLMTVIDPGLEWSTYLGGSGRDEVKAMLLDASGDVIVAGITESGDFPTTAGVYRRTHSAPRGCLPPSSCGDGFVSKLSPDGQRLIWSTFLGGTNPTGNDAIRAIAFDPQGNLVIGGNTTSGFNFPVVPNPGAYKTNSTVGTGQSEVFIAKLSGRGNALLYSSFFSNAGGDRLTTLAVDSQGAAVFGGTTIGALPSFPRPGAFRTTLNCSSSYHPPLTNDPTAGTGGGGNNSVTGGTHAPSGCGGDSFIARLNPLGQGPADLTYCTYLGGTNFDSLTGLVVDTNDTVIATGYTNSCNFPTTPGALSEGPLSPDLCPAPLMDGFVTKLRLQGAGQSDLLYSSYVGGYDNDYIYGIRLSTPGVVALTGATYSWDFPVTQDAYSTQITNLPGLKSDAFALLLDTAPGLPPYAQVGYGTYLGGDDTDSGQAIASDPIDGALLIAGFTASADFPRSGDPFQSQFVGGPTIAQDAFVSRITPQSHAAADLTYSTFLGGVGWDQPNALEFEASNSVLVAGFTGTGSFLTNDFPMRNAMDSTYGNNIVSNNNRDAFITKLVLPQLLTLRMEGPATEVAPGGLLSYDVIFTNSSSENQSVVFKVDAYGPDGSPYSGNPVDRLRNADLPPNQSLRFTFNHRIPGTTRSPSGPYTLRAKMFPYVPGPTQGIGSFVFTVR